MLLFSNAANKIAFPLVRIFARVSLRDDLARPADEAEYDYQRQAPVIFGQSVTGKGFWSVRCQRLEIRIACECALETSRLSPLQGNWPLCKPQIVLGSPP